MSTRPIRQVIQNRPMLLGAADLKVREATQLMAKAHVGSIMIVDQERLVGIFTERDLLFRVVAPGLNPETTTLAEVMTPDPQTITADHELGHALHLMHDGAFRHMPVVEDGRPVGMISVRDALSGEMLEFEQELEQREIITELL